uniref:Uncharacterized protein n=1 Tax=Caenorhabditis japonica TaxID=281687 RepID=A0A8R1EKA4_CAEJA
MKSAFSMESMVFYIGMVLKQPCGLDGVVKSEQTPTHRTQIEKRVSGVSARISDVESAKLDTALGQRPQ